MASASDPSPSQELLRQSEQRYRLLVEQVQDYAIFLLDLDGRVVSWNSGAERIKGYSRDEILGRHFSVFYTSEDVAQNKPQRALQRAINEGRFEDEAWRIRKDGSRFWANIVLTALHDEAGQLQGFAKVTRDLTARRLNEEQARQLAAERAARAEAEVANRRKDEFLAMLAHELRNPLAPLFTSVQILRQADADVKIRQESLDRMERQLQHLGRLVNELLEASRFARGLVTLRPERLDLGRLVRSVAEDRRPLLEQIPLSLTVEVPEVPVWLQGDPTRLSQALNNLLDNSAKYTKPGGQVQVRLTVEQDREIVVLTVRDTGIGIPEDVLRHLFEPFAQADRSLHRSDGGLGLGLSITKGLVELHGGKVEAASAGPGQGTEITLRLPTEAEPAALTGPPVQMTTGRRHSILVIEDQRDAADSLRTLLQLLGHEVRVAYSGPEGVQAAAESLPDVVISDIGLPGFDGFEVARRIRSLPGMEEALLLALTGYGSEDDRRRSRESGFNHHLVKPADPSDLQHLLAQNVS